MTDPEKLNEQIQHLKNAFAEVLTRNLGQKLTPELANGFIVALDQIHAALPEPQKQEEPPAGEVI
jgi:hypothetical protein